MKKDLDRFKAILRTAKDTNTLVTPDDTEWIVDLIRRSPTVTALAIWSSCSLVCGIEHPVTVNLVREIGSKVTDILVAAISPDLTVERLHSDPFHLYTWKGW